MNEEEFHPWLAELGAYVVGALEPDEAEALRRHLGTCPVCQEEYQRLSPTARLLAMVPAEAFEPADQAGAAPAGPDPAMWERLRERAGLSGAPAAPRPPAVAPPRVPAVAASAEPQAAPAPGPKRPAAPSAPRPRSRTRPRLRWPSRPAASAALSGALVAVAAVGVFVGVQAGGGSSVPVSSVSAADTATGVSGTVQYRPTDWGSWVQVTLKGVPPGDDCVMYAVDGHGHQSVAGSWWAPYNGSRSATIPGGVAMQASMIRQFVVETTNGQVLLTVPVS
jgi:anti-sigma factor RsiW